MFRSLLLTTLLVGCASSNVSTAELDEALAAYDSEAAPGDEVIKPRNGSWQYTSVEILSDTCAKAIDMVEVTDGFSTDRDGRVFDMRFDGAANADCLVDTDTFGCDPLTDAATPDDTVTLTTDSLTRGRMLTRDDMDGVHEINISCEGVGCAAIAASEDINFPCRFGVFFTAETLAP